MDVQLRHGLSGSGTIVGADVKPVGLEFGDRCCLGLIEQLQERDALLTADLEGGADVARGNNEAVAR